MSVLLTFVALVVFLIGFIVSLIGTLAIIFVAFVRPDWLKGISGKWRFLSWLVLSILSVLIYVFLARYFFTPDGCYLFCSGNYQDLYRAAFGYGINTLYLFLTYLICTRGVKGRNDELLNQDDEPYYRRIEEFAPKFLSGFGTKLVEFTDLRVERYPHENHPHYVCRQLVCKCGEEKLHLSVPSTRNKLFKRLFSGKNVSYQPLVLVKCPSCSSTCVAFDQQLHGWGAMFDELAKIDTQPHQVYNPEPMKVYVGLSYQWLNHYERALLENEAIGVDLENYIDHIDFYLGFSQRSELVFGFTCALSENYDYDW